MGQYVSVQRDVRVYIEDIGPKSGPVLLLLHGWPLSHKAYEYQFIQLPKLGIRCIGMDMRGFGQSDRPFDGYDYNRLADDVRAVIDAMELGDITLAGHSMGGAVALRYMTRHNAHGVLRLALFAAAAPSFVRRPDFALGFAQSEVSELIDQACNDRPALLHRFGEMFFNRFISAPMAQWFFDIGLAASGWAAAHALLTLRDATLFGDIGKIHVPTLLMHGVHDRICPFGLGETQHRAIRGSVLIPFEHSGHGLFIEQQAEFNSNLARFVQLH